MSKDELLKAIIKELGKTKKEIEKEMNGKDRENPVNIEIIRTQKAGFYEEVMTQYKKYKKGKK